MEDLRGEGVVLVFVGGRMMSEQLNGCVSVVNQTHAPDSFFV